MAARYKYAFNAAYCRTVIARFYRQRLFYFLLSYQFALIAAIVLLAWFTTHAAAQPSPVSFKAVCITGAVLLGFLLMMRAAVLLKLRGSREFGNEVTIVLSDEGLEASGPNGHSIVKWSAYPRSVRFADGFLLMRGGAIRWLPDAALEQGSVDAALSLIRSKTSLRSIGASR
jgi:hypothetical protein